MQYLILSDSHGHTDAVEQALERHPAAQTVLFLGDGLREIENLSYEYDNRRFVMVAGNCDLYPTEPLCREEIIADTRVLLTHGHLFSVKSGLSGLLNAAVERKAEIALFGHTHIPLCRIEMGRRLFNPGSIGKSGHYGLLTVEKGGITLQNMQL